jgi:hypothetical protein
MLIKQKSAHPIKRPNIYLDFIERVLFSLIVWTIAFLLYKSLPHLGVDFKLANGTVRKIDFLSFADPILWAFFIASALVAVPLIRGIASRKDKKYVEAAVKHVKQDCLCVFLTFGSVAIILDVLVRPSVSLTLWFLANYVIAFFVFRSMTDDITNDEVS